MSDFDAIIVGAGLAGSSAAYRLAKGGAEVLLVERSSYPGSKNLSGGVLFGRVLEELIPDCWDDAPLERHINRNVVTFMTSDTTFNMDFKSQAFGKPPYNGFTVLRAKLDRWLAEKAESAGAALVPGVKVDSLIITNGAVKGIVAGEDEMTADVVIAADGVLSYMAEQAGLRGRHQPANLAVGVKQLIGLDRAVLEERFSLSGDEGVAYSMVGAPTRGTPGGAFLYTNSDSLSIGLVIHCDHCVQAKVSPIEVMDEFLDHPFIASLIRGGRTLEYGAHLVAEGGVAAMPKLFTHGMLVAGEAAGLGLNNGFTVRGMDLAIGSGICAADTVLEAKERADFSAASLAAYEQKLSQSYVLKDMRAYAGAVPFMKTERLFNEYPQLVAQIMGPIYTQASKPKENLLPILLRARKESGVSFASLAKDAWKAVRNL